MMDGVRALEKLAGGGLAARHVTASWGGRRGCHVGRAALEPLARGLGGAMSSHAVVIDDESAPGWNFREQLFAEVVASCTGLVTRIAASCENDHAVRRELVQDILMAIWEALPSFRGDSALRTFVASIAHKRSISHVARRAREPRKVELPEDLVSAALRPDEAALHSDMMRRLDRSIARLPAPQREAIILCFNGFSHGEVAQALGISVNAAMLRCQRAKMALKALLHPEN